MKGISSVVFLSVVLIAASANARVPSSMNYQGALTDQYGVALDDTVSLTLSIYTEPEGGLPLWDETQTGVVVSHGVFNVLLGSVNPLADDVFAEPNRWLGVRVGADPELTPRQQIVTVGYAFRAAEADTADVVRGGSSGSDGDWIISGNDMYSGVSGNVGIGISNPQKKLHVSSTISSFGMVTIERASTTAGEASIGFKERSDAGGDSIWVAGVGGWGNTSDFVIGWGAPKFLITPSAEVGIGTNTPMSNLHVKGTDWATYVIVDAPSGYAPGLMFDVNSAVEWRIYYHPGDAHLGFYREGVGERMVIKNNGNVGIGTSSPTGKLQVTGGNAIFESYVGIGTTSPSRQLHIVGANPRILLEASSINPEINFKNSGDGASEIWAVYKHGTTDDLRFYQNGDKLTIQTITGNVGIGTASPSEKLHVNGTVKCDVLKLTGGADIAEPFEVAETQAMQPGMALTIDPDCCGSLKLADRAYDRRVAGVVSGAGHIEPGLIMSRSVETTPREHPVALTGRVYCWADASYGSIQPGDLLTTSDTPGHAMKASDHDRAQGAVLGKAMSSLEEGRGLVLVLVSLQ